MRHPRPSMHDEVGAAHPAIVQILDVVQNQLALNLAPRLLHLMLTLLVQEAVLGRDGKVR